MMRLFASPGTQAGRKAGKSWLRILDQTDEEIETLTGMDLYTHAKEEARKWLRSHYKIENLAYRPREEYHQPEQSYHEEFLEYIEAFVSAFPPRIHGYPKEYVEENA